MPQTRARATARPRFSPSSRRSWPAPTRGRSSSAPPPSSAGGLHLEGSASPWRRAAPFASPTSWCQGCPTVPSALPLSTKLGTAVAGVVKDCVDPVARPFRCRASAESQKTEHLDRPSQDPHAEPTNRSTGPCRAVTRWGRRPTASTLRVSPGTRTPVSPGCPTCKAKAVRDETAAPSACKDS